MNQCEYWKWFCKHISICYTDCTIKLVEPGSGTVLDCSIYRYGFCKLGDYLCTNLSIFRQSLRSRDALPELIDSIKRPDKKSCLASALAVILISLYVIIHDAMLAQFRVEFWSLFITSCLVFLSWLVTVHNNHPLTSTLTCLLLFT